MEKLKSALRGASESSRNTLTRASNGFADFSQQPSLDQLDHKAMGCRYAQILFAFLAMCLWAGTAGFQAKWDVGPSFLSGLSIAISVLLLLLSSALLLIPFLYIKKDWFRTADQFLKERRSEWVLNGIGGGLSLLIATITTGSAFSTPGCKDPAKDPNEKKGDDFKNALSDFCGTKKAGSIFFWLVFLSWAASLILVFLNFRRTSNRRRDPPFAAPGHEHDAEASLADDADSVYGGRPLNPYDADPSDPYSRLGAGDERGRYSQSSEQDYNSYQLPPVTGGQSTFEDPFARGRSPAPAMPEPQFEYTPGASPTPPPRESLNAKRKLTLNELVGGAGMYSGGAAAAAAPRPSIDQYGAYNDPAPSGYGGRPY